MDLARLLPVHRITLVSSSETRLQKWYQKELPVEEADSLEAIRGCDFVDVLRVQRERFEGGENSLEYQRAKGRFRIGPREIEMAGRDTLFMHPQPIADNEIDPSVWRHKQVIMDEEARNGVPIRMAAIAQSVRRLDQKDFSEPPSPCVKELWSGAAAERTRRKHNEERYYHLLTHGTAIDHLAPDCGEVVRTHLRRRASEQGGVTVLTEGLRTQRMVGGRKDRLALEGRFLTPDEMAFVQFLCPQATFNEIREGTLSKRRLTEGGHIRGLLRCPNPKCITNCDAEARLHPHFQVPRGETDLCICHFCEQRFTRVEMLAELKK
jgi:aspartate carbamoyltransferase regulatory subunit